jgi:PKD domain-containing protein
LRVCLLPGFRALLVSVLVFTGAACGTAQVGSGIQAAPIPDEMRDSFFAVMVNNQRVDVAHAASKYEFVSFNATGPLDVSITAADPHFWDGGVDIEPWRLGLRASHPEGEPQTIRFRVTGPVKLAISRPGDFLNQARMLFLFADAPPAPAPSGPNVTIIPAGVHQGSLNPKSGDTIYLEPGAFVFGSLNLWQVENVKVLGQGTIVYDGPQDASSDTGWMQKPDWHCIVSYQAHNVEIDGLTCIIRSRTWSIQMKDSTGLRFDDLRVIGGNPGNANQDGMDWLGGGDTVVNHAFIRASDDDLAALGNWDGYTQAALTAPGADVSNVLVENSELSTSISNVVRLGWPQKIYNLHNFTLRDSDILHAGIGACGQTFGLLGFWGANGASGDHSGVTFENLILDNWYSLAQMEQEQPSLHGVMFRNIWALDQPPLAESTMIGDVSDVSFDNVKYGQTRVTSDAQMPLAVAGGAAEPTYAPAPALAAAFSVESSVIAPRQNATFIANGAAGAGEEAPGAEYTWLFGDGTSAHGRTVRHRFPDALGTQLDGRNGAGRFRVLLHVTDKAGHQDWSAQGVVVVGQLHDAAVKHDATHGLVSLQGTEPNAGLNWKAYLGTWTALPDFSMLQPQNTGVSADLEVQMPSLTLSAEPAPSSGFPLTAHATGWDGFIDIPTEGGYTFHLIDSDGARLTIDGMEVAKTGPPFGLVCGAVGNALQYDRGAIGLKAGLHAIHVEALNTATEGAPRLLWEGPGLALEDVPAEAFSHGSR